jgi:hypothetical protein
MEPRLGMTRSGWFLIGGCAACAIGLTVAATAIQNGSDGLSEPIRADTMTQGAALVKQQPVTPLGVAKGATPMAERVATIGVLNKRNGLSRDLVMKPGEAVRMGDLVIRLKACDQTEPWEADQLTGAFVQVIVKNTIGTNWRKVFSGWLFRESPSLNTVEHPVYDVWVKACTMRHPEAGPNTVVLSGDAAGKVPSKAKKSGTEAPAPTTDEPDESDDSAALSADM